MTAPDAREWYRLDPDGPVVRQHQEAVAEFKAAHPTVTFARMTILGIDRGEPWLCIDGWRATPDDQGPAPTDADIPIGFW
jgi:hypothetical protein